MTDEKTIYDPEGYRGILRERCEKGRGILRGTFTSSKPAHR